MRRVVLGLGLLALVAFGLAVAYRALRPHAPNIHGSTTQEYVPTTTPRPRPSEPGIAWATYGYDQERLRVATFPVRPPFRRLWTFHGRTLLEFPPAVAYGRVYLPTFTGHLYALDAHTGKVLWHYSSGHCGWSSPAVAAHTVFITFIGNAECGSQERGGEVVALDARSGRTRWRRQIGPSESSPLVAGGSTYVGDWNGRIWALDSKTGKTRWTFDTSGAIKGSLALSGRRLYIGNYDGALYSIDARRGRQLWRSGGHGSFYSSPAVAYGRVYIGSLDSGVYAFGAATGHLLWSHPTGGYVYASPAVWNRLVLIGSYDHNFYALDAGTGDTRWRLRANGPISGSASVINGLVYFSTFAEKTYAAGAANGLIKKTWPDGKYSPAVADRQHLYLVGLGRLYAYASSR